MPWEELMLLGSEPALLNLCFIFVNQTGRGPEPSTKHNPRLLLDVFPVETNSCSSLRFPLYHLLFAVSVSLASSFSEKCTYI